MAGAVALLLLSIVSRRKRAAAIAAVCVVSVAGNVRAQQKDSTNCDSVVFAARRDSVHASIFLSLKALDAEITDQNRHAMETAVATGFIPPRPFRISVFAGPAQMRAFRRMGADTLTELRAPTVTGVYRFTTTRVPQPETKVEIFRASLIPGFDLAVVEAIRAGVAVRGIFDLPANLDSIQLEVRFATDSTAGALRLVDAVFPRMPVVDAVANADNPTPKLPIGAQDDSTRRFDVLLRFVVDRDGAPALETVEVLRANSMSFLREVFDVLPRQRFRPGRVNGCAIAQVVSYPFTFVVPPAGMPPRH